MTRGAELRILTVNAGSSSLKLGLLGPGDEVEAARQITAPGGEVDRAALAGFLKRLRPPDAVAHRIVHGGERFDQAVRVDAKVEATLRDLAELAPLHQVKSLAALDAVTAALPEAPAVACFDTAFHRTLPESAATYALPAAWRRRYGLRRFGFHGLSHAYVARRAAELLGRNDLRLVSCHLGAGASLAAIRGGVCLDTTMGFTPLEGLVMATRSGSVDPGLLLWLLEREASTAPALANALEHESGLLGLAGTAEMQEVIARAAAGGADAELALGVYVHRLRAAIAAMTAALGGLEALAFTAGVGENAATVRGLAIDGLGYLGLDLDGKTNETARPDSNVGSADGVPVLVIAAREDLEMAREVRSLLGG